MVVIGEMMQRNLESGMCRLDKFEGFSWSKQSTTNLTRCRQILQQFSALICIIYSNESTLVKLTYLSTMEGIVRFLKLHTMCYEPHVDFAQILTLCFRIENLKIDSTKSGIDVRWFT